MGGPIRVALNYACLPPYSTDRKRFPTECTTTHSGHRANYANIPTQSPYQRLRRRHRPSWTCACGNGASCRPSSRCAWPSAGPPSSCRPSWRTPSCATNVSWAPWCNRLETTNERQLLRARQSGDVNRNATVRKQPAKKEKNMPSTKHASARDCRTNRVNQIRDKNNPSGSHHQ